MRRIDALDFGNLRRDFLRTLRWRRPPLPDRTLCPSGRREGRLDAMRGGSSRERHLLVGEIQVLLDDEPRLFPRHPYFLAGLGVIEMPCLHQQLHGGGTEALGGGITGSVIHPPPPESPSEPSASARHGVGEELSQD